jgi:chromosome segregation ATPase
MEVGPAHLAALVGGAVAVNQILGALREWGASRLRAGREEGSETAAVVNISKRLNGIDRLHEQKVPQFEELRVMVARGQEQISALTRTISDFVIEQRDTNRDVRENQRDMNRALRVVATAMGVRLNSETDIPRVGGPK